MSIINVKKAGVSGDGSHIETAEIQKVINDATDGDTILFPCGHYVTGTLSLRSNITIILEKGAELIGSRNIEHYRDCGFYHNEMKQTTSLIYALDCENICIKGEGKIQLNGDAFMDFRKYIPSELGDAPVSLFEAEQMVVAVVKRPTQPIFFNNCKNIVINGIEIFNSPCWTLVFSNCENITVENIYMDNHNRIPNNDGIHCSASKNITVKNCTFLCGDDCFAATCITNWNGICENIEISDCLMSSRSAAIRFGHLESKVKNATIKNIKVIRSNRAVSIFTGDNGYVENIHFENIISDTKIHGGFWWGKGEPIVICAKDATGTISDISFSDCLFTHESPAIICGSDGNVNNISFNNCRFDVQKGETHKYYLDKMDLQPNVPFLTSAPYKLGEHMYVSDADVNTNDTIFGEK